MFWPDVPQKTTTMLVFFLPLVNYLKKLVNNSLVDHLKKCDLFSAFQYGLRYSRSTVDLVRVISARIARAFNRSEPTQA